MIDLSQNGVPHEQVLNALHFLDGRRQVRFTLHTIRRSVRHRQLVLLEQELRCSYESPVKYTARFTVQDDSAVNWRTDLLECSLVVVVNDRELSYSFPRLKPVTISGDGVLKIWAKDESIALLRSSLGSRLFLLAGTRYTSAVEAILSDSGFSDIAIEPSLRTLAFDRESWAPECPRLSVINELLSEIGYRSLECLPGGLLASGRYRLPDDTPCLIRYQTGPKSVILHERSLLKENLGPNHFVGYVSNLKSGGMRYEYAIEDASNPLSPAANGGYRITAVRQYQNVCDRESLALLVKRWALENAKGYETLTLKTAVMPHHGVREIVYLDCGALSGKFIETGFVIADDMTHTLRRISYD